MRARDGVRSARRIEGRRDAVTRRFSSASARGLACLVALVAAAPQVATAATAPGSGSGDKSQYHLFNPTPRDRMRELSTDRPDVTESPHTVDAGHFQVELSLVEYIHDNSGGAELDEFVILPSNLKVGLLNNLDLQFVLEPYVYQRVRDEAGGRSVNNGLGNMQVRAKLNVWGNDGGETALAVMPYVQLPTASGDLGGTDHLEGGVIVPLAIDLPNEFGLGLMAEVDVLRDADDESYGLSFLHTAALGRPIVGGLNGYVEYVGIASRELDAGYIALVGGGLTYAMGDNAQLDGGVYFGLSDKADDFRAFLGLSLRL